MKKLVSILLVLTLVMSSAIFAVNAEGDPTFRLSDASAALGETVTVDLSIENNPGIAALSVKVGYDASVLSLTSVDSANLLGAVSTSPLDKNPVSISWYEPASKNRTESGIFATISFVVVGSTSTTSPVTIEYNPNDVSDIDENNVTFATVNGSVTVNSSAPAPVVTDPVPVVTDPAPVTTDPEPVATNAPEATTAAPEATTFAPAATQPATNAPAATQPAQKNTISAAERAKQLKDIEKAKKLLEFLKKKIKKNNPMKVKFKNRKVKASKLKKKAVTVKVCTVKKAKGKVVYKKRSCDKELKLLKNGKVKIKKGTPKGYYSLVLIVKAKGNSKYYSEEISEVVEIRVK